MSQRGEGGVRKGAAFFCYRTAWLPCGEINPESFGVRPAAKMAVLELLEAEGLNRIQARGEICRDERGD